jgi:hypothetical protein
LTNGWQVQWGGTHVVIYIDILRDPGHEYSSTGFTPEDLSSDNSAAHVAAVRDRPTVFILFNTIALT